MTITELLTKISELTNTQNTTASSYPTTSKTRDINLALDNYFILANSATGNWRPADDTNLSDYPIVYGDLVSGQQDYSFTVDEAGNQILDIYKVRVKATNGIDWITLEQINQDTITDDQLSTVNGGTPSQYYLTANGIFLVQKSNYASTDGLEISISRTPYHFTSSDVATGTKVAGIYWVHQEYLAIRPSYFYCLAKGLPQANNYKITLNEMELAIKKFYKDRNKDFSQSITPETISSI